LLLVGDTGPNNGQKAEKASHGHFSLDPTFNFKFSTWNLKG
jgi:hypothetical protein